MTEPVEPEAGEHKLLTGAEVLAQVVSARIVLQDSEGNELLWVAIDKCHAGDTITYTIPTELKMILGT